MIYIENGNNSLFDWSLITSGIAIFVSIIALIRNSRYSRTNIRLTIQQSILKMATEKAKDCNLLWEREIVNERDPSSPHFRIITEIIITTEVIEKSFEWFEKNDKSVV